MLRLALIRFLESYFKHRWLYLLPIVLMTLAAGAYIFLSKPKYLAEGVIFVQRESFLARLTSVQPADVAWQTPSSITVGEINALLQTNSFVRAIIENTDLEAQMNQGQAIVSQTIDEVRKALWATSIGNDQVRLSGAHENPVLAYQMVNSLIDTYTQWKINADQKDSEAAHTFLTNLIAGYKADLDQARQKLDDYLQAHPQPLKGDRPLEEQSQITRLQSDIDLAQTRYVNALNKDEDARLAAAQAESDVRQSYIIIDASQLPTKPERSMKTLAVTIAVFLVVGIMLSGAGILGSALLDRSFHYPIDVWHGINLPVLAMLPGTGARTDMKTRKARKQVGFRDKKRLGRPVKNEQGIASVTNPQLIKK